ncbi:MAG: YceI family protein [Alphaproteobacteria bacterium]|nr:YceI family protein [Alphaproteobacteria bacterium]
MRRFALFLSLALIVSRPVFAQIEVYDFDKPHTQIMFFVDHLGFSRPEGEFLDFDGSFTFDRGEPAKSHVEIAIKTASIQMDDEAWNKHMMNADFFNVEKFPEMTFRSTAIEVTGESTANITGDLTILGITKPVVLAVTHNKSGKFPFGDRYVAGFSGRTTIKRSDFGMVYGLPGVGDEVEIRLEVEGVRNDEGGTGNP